MKTKSAKGIVGIGVVGLGRGMSYVKNAKEIMGGELLAICSLDEEKLNAVAAEYGVDSYTDFDTMIERDDIDLVVVASPSGLHSDMAVKAARKGKYVLSEKPMDITLEKIDAAVAEFKARGLYIGCIFQNRFAAPIQYTKKLIDSGRLGKPIYFNAQVKWHRTDEYYLQNGGWRGTWAMDGGGSLMNQSVHTIDLMQWFMGPVKSVFGSAKIYNHNIETEDLGTALVKFQNGAVGTMMGSTATYPGFGTFIEIHGENGGILIKDNTIAEVKIKDAAPEEIADIIGKYGPKDKRVSAGASDPNAIAGDTTLYQFQDMVNAVAEKRPPVITADKARFAVEIILAIYKSSKENKEVVLPL